MGFWKVPHQPEERRAQLLNRRERELHLGFDPSSPADPKLAPGPGGVFQQGGLADARFAIYHQYIALPAARAFQQPVEHLALALASE